MSEIAKCPCCGGQVQQYDGPYASSFIACNSEDDECMFVCDIKNFTLITAAMGQALPAIRLAMEDQRACEQRVLEVFK